MKQAKVFVTTNCTRGRIEETTMEEVRMVYDNYLLEEKAYSTLDIVVLNIKKGFDYGIVLTTKQYNDMKSLII